MLTHVVIFENLPIVFLLRVTSYRKEWYFILPATISSVQFSHSVVSDSLRPHELQHVTPPCPSPTPGVHSDSTSIESSIQPSHPLSSPSPAFSLSQHQGLFQGVSSLHQVAKVLELQFQHQSFL